MNMNKWVITGVVSLTMVAATAGMVVAATDNSSSTDKAQSGHLAIHSKWQSEGNQRVQFQQNSQIAKILGIDETELNKELKSGQTLAQIATSKGIDVNTLIQQIENAFNTNIDQKVAEGKLTSDQATKMKENFVNKATAMVNKTYKASQHKTRGSNGVIQQIQTILWVDAATLKQDLASGKTIAQIAQDKGIATNDLVSQIQTALEANIDKAVTDNKISSESATKMKNNLTNRIQNIVNRQHLKKRNLTVNAQS